jgi:hypothetical protein
MSMMTNQEFISYFTRQKETFLKEYRIDSYEKALNWFERWLREEGAKGEDNFAREQICFEDFTDLVLARAAEILRRWGVKITYPSARQWLGAKNSWRCIVAFENRNIFYRFGKTRPRKGPQQNQELLVIDLVMDGQKKQVFQPLLEQKQEIEAHLGEPLVRELPRVEATGKYRLKLLLPFQLVEKGEIDLLAEKLAGFILATKKALNKIGVV